MGCTPSAIGDHGETDQEELVTRTRRIVVFILLIFAIYAIVVSPSQSADIVRTAFDTLAEAIRAIFRFFDALLRR
jgi:hypothetical protein